MTITLTPDNPNDRLIIAIFAAITLHISVILGVDFDFVFPKELKNIPKKIEVILVHSKTEDKPEESDYLAQVSQAGGGNIEEKVRPSSPLANPKPVVREMGKSPQNQEMQIPQQQRQNKQQQILTVQQSQQQQRIELHQEETPELQPNMDIQQLMVKSREIARLSAEIRDRQQLYAQMPRQKYITANTKEYIFASYEESWRMKVERVGNINYPDQAIRNKLTGNLLIDVAIKADGAVSDIQILRSSGSKVLDDGAIYIIKLASPFSPFTPAMRKQTDILHITRVWQFKDGNRLSTR